MLKILAALALVSASLAAVDGRIYAVAKDRSTLRYNVKHKLHEVDAESHEIDGKAKLLPDGTVQLMVRAPVASFRSGDGNRDEHMQETMQSSTYPFVAFKGIAHIQPPLSYPAALEVPISGELDFHGRKSPETVTMHVEMQSADAWHVKGDLQISLEKYQVERPSLLLVKLEDECTVEIDLQLAGM